MLNILVYATALALAWSLIVGRFTPEVFLVGLAAGVALAARFRPTLGQLSWRRLPLQLLALAQYVLALFRDIFFSGLDVARRVLSPDMRLKLGILAVSTQDSERSPVILALSANYISLTPGELVVEVADNHLMYVHCLDIEASARAAEQTQARRLALLQTITRRDE